MIVQKVCCLNEIDLNFAIDLEFFHDRQAMIIMVLMGPIQHSLDGMRAEH